MAGPAKTWTLAYTRERYMEVAHAVAGTPKCHDLGPHAMHAIHRLGLNMPTMAKLCGLRPNRHKAPRSPLPETIAPMPAPEGEPDPRGNRGPRLRLHPRVVAPRVIVRDPVLARERKASEKRRRKRLASEGMHVPPLPGPLGHAGRKIPRWDDFVPPVNLAEPGLRQSRRPAA